MKHLLVPFVLLLGSASLAQEEGPGMDFNEPETPPAEAPPPPPPEE